MVVRLAQGLGLAAGMLALTASGASGQAPPAALHFAASEVQFRDLAAVVHVVPEARTDVQVTLVNGGPLGLPLLRTEGRRLVVDGGLARRISGCQSNAGMFRVRVNGRGWLDQNALPHLEVRMPRQAVVDAGGAVRLTIGPSDSVRLNLAGCGDADVERVNASADVAVAGGGLDLRLYEAGSAAVRIAGAGDVDVGAVHSGLTVSVAGAGDFTAAHADGPTNIAIQGSGDVTIRDGRAPTLSVMIAGSGDMRHGGEADRLDAVILGSGDVRVRRVTGQVSRRVFGSGDVSIGGK